jgi:GntP family gluconate:H+ symporter
MESLLFLLLVLVFIIVATAKFNIHPFFTLLIAALAMGFFLGFDSNTIVSTITEGFGKTLSGIGIIIALGATIGILLEKSGGTKVMAETILSWVGMKRSALAINLTGFVISIPVFCDSGFILLSSLNKALSRKTGISLVVYAVALAAGLYATHVFVPPTPGPLAAAAVLEANLGLVMILGLVVALPVALAGYFWAQYIGKKIMITPEAQVEKEEQRHQLPGAGAAFAPVFIPVLLIAIRSIADYPTHPLGETRIYEIISFIGDPLVALLIGVLFAFRLTGSQEKGKQLSWVATALKDAGAIILLTGAGGAFGNVLRASDLGSLLGDEATFLSAGILLAFVIAAVLKTAQGSSTVAIITTAAIVAPLLMRLGLDSATGRALTVLAIGAGAMTVSHVNDSFFWVVAEFSNMDMKTALKSQTISTFLQGLTGLAIILILNMFL